MKQAFEIENDVPIPQNPLPSRNLSGALRGMEVGQSVFIANRPIESCRAIICQTMRKSPNKHFINRVDTNNGAWGLRIWRIA